MSKVSKFEAGYQKFVAAGGSKYDDYMRELADTHGINYDLWHKQIYLESRFDPKAKSPTGVRGIAQFTGATGRAYGLRNEDDLYNPMKALDASARHFKDLVRNSNGDEVRAMLAYNRGEGSVGRSDLQAYDRGDYDSIGGEGNNYIKLLGSAAQGAPESFRKYTGGVAPKPATKEAERRLGLNRQPSANQFPQEGDTFESNQAIDDKMTVGFNEVRNSKVQEYPWTSEVTAAAAQQPAGLNDAQAPVTSPSVDFRLQQGGTASRAATTREMIYDATGRQTDGGERGWFEGGVDATVQSAIASPLGAIYRTRDEGGFSDMMNMFTSTPHPESNWSYEDGERWEALGVDPAYFQTIASGTREMEETNIRIALGTQKARAQAAKASQSGHILGQLVGGTIGDPLTYAGGAVKGASVASRFAKGAALGGGLNVAAEKVNTNVTGGDADYLMAAAGGALLGGTLGAAFGQRTPRADLKGAVRNPSEIHTAPENAKLSDKLEDSIHESTRNVEQHMDITQGKDVVTKSVEDFDPARTKEGTFGVYEVQDDGSVIMGESGARISAGNIFNPESLHQFTEMHGLPSPFGTASRDWTPQRGAQGVGLGDFGTAGYQLNQTKSPELLALVNDTFRSPTGYKDGSQGVPYMATQDIASRLGNTDRQTLTGILGDLQRHEGRNAVFAKRNPSDDHFEGISRNIGEARESGDYSKVPKDLQDTAKKLGKLLDDKFEAGLSPSKFGRIDAPPVFSDGGGMRNYYPVHWNRHSINDLVKQVGGDIEQVKDAFARSFIESYRKDPKVRAEVDKFLTETVENVDLNTEVIKYAKGVAKGIVENDGKVGANNSTLAADSAVTGLSSLADSPHLRMRHKFGNNAEVEFNGGLFSPNDMRKFNIGQVIPAYTRGINGHIALHGGTGKTTGQVVDEINNLRSKATAAGDKQLVKEIDQYSGMLKALTGHSRADKAEGSMQASLRALANLTYAGRNAYFALQSLGEVAALVTKGHVSLIMNRVPIVNKLLDKNHILSLKDTRELRGDLMGMELSDMIRNSRSSTIDSVKEGGAWDGTAAVTGGLKYYTNELTARMPTSRAVTGLQNIIVEAGQMGALTDVINHTFKIGKVSKLVKLDDEKYLRSMGLTEEIYSQLQDHMKKYIVPADNKGKKKMAIKNREEFIDHPLTNDLWRFLDAAANEAVIRQDRIQNMTAGHMNAGWSMLTQFKSFSLQSLNARTVKGFHDATKNGRAVDQTLTAIVSSGLAAGVYGIQTSGTAMSMPEGKRKAYLDRALTPEMVAYAALTRASHAQGAAAGVFNMVAGAVGYHPAQMVRSSVEKTDWERREDSPMKALTGNSMKNTSAEAVFDNLSQQVPSVATAKGLYKLGHNAVAKGLSGDVPQTDFHTGMHEAFRSLLPNDPVTQMFVNNFFEEQMGVKTRR